MFNLSEQTLRHFVQNASCDALQEKLDSMASAMGDEAFIKRVAREIVERTQPQQAIPDIYRHYRTVVRDGIEFFLSQADRQRLMDLVASQLKLKPEADTQERLLELAKHFPTLHKLGQIIARNPNIDPLVKKWLIHLENGSYGTAIDGVMERIDRQLEQTDNRQQVHILPAILSEASVGVVIPFDWQSSQGRIKGVFKVLKPGIRKYLDEELVILEKTAAFFEEKRDDYPLKDFKFLDVFQEVREMLVNEIDLAAERTYLVEAAQFYKDMENIQIPGLFPFGTDTVTAMSYLNGSKITDAALTPEQRKHCAAVLFEALVCRPLFSRCEQSLFHGDPHAGNILAVNDPASDQLKIGLVDWSLAGRLTKRDRVKTAQLIQAVLKEDLSSIRRSIKALANSGSMDSSLQRQKFRNRVLRMMQSSDYAGLPLIKRAFKLLEELTFEGFVFPGNLMLFRKAVFTLEGVLYDLWPSFDMDAAVRQYLTVLMTREVPKRFVNLFFPLADRPENYQSLVSNIELQSLMIHQYFATIRFSAHSFAGYYLGWWRMFNMPSRPVPAPVLLSEETKK